MRWSKEDDARLQELFGQGCTRMEISDWLGRPLAAVNYRMRTLNMKRGGSGRRSSINRRKILTSSLRPEDKGLACDAQASWYRSQVLADRKFQEQMRKKRA